MVKWETRNGVFVNTVQYFVFVFISTSNCTVILNKREAIKKVFNWLSNWWNPVHLCVGIIIIILKKIWSIKNTVILFILNSSEEMTICTYVVYANKPERFYLIKNFILKMSWRLRREKERLSECWGLNLNRGQSNAMQFITAIRIKKVWLGLARLILDLLDLDNLNSAIREIITSGYV